MDVRVEHSFLTYVSDPTEIRKELELSKEKGNVIGIFAISLGPTMVMTAVDEIIDIKNDTLVILKEADLLGMQIAEEKIFLSEIVRVHRFNTQYDDPFHVRLRGKKD